MRVRVPPGPLAHGATLNPVASDNEYMRVYMTERYHRRRTAAIEQLGGVCVGCGSDEGLIFDHVDPATKAFDVGKIFSGGSEAKVQAELAKCQLLCGSCEKAKTKGDLRILMRGEANGQSKLTEEIVRAIRSSDDSAAVLAARYEVSKFCIYAALSGRTWGYVSV